MKHDLIEFFQNARKKRPEKFRHHFSVFLSCLGISVFLWLLVHLSKDYSYRISYQLHYKQVPSSLRMTGFSDSILQVTIKVQGFEFFSERFLASRNRDIDVSLKGIKVKAEEDQYTGYLLSRGISAIIATESKYPLEIFETSPDTLYFTFEKKGLKKFSSIRPAGIQVSNPGNRNDSGKTGHDTIRSLKSLNNHKK